MEFLEITKILFRGLKQKLENDKGLAVFAKERAKFEGWLKVVLVGILSDYFSDVVPENSRIDLTFGEWAIELKTMNTNIRYTNVKNKHRPITKNVDGVIKDITNLKSCDFLKKGILFIVFPIEHENEYWQIQLNKIKNKLSRIEYMQFLFFNKIPGVIYFGEIIN
jgi:hypothetical protein